MPPKASVGPVAKLLNVTTVCFSLHEKLSPIRFLQRALIYLLFIENNKFIEFFQIFISIIPSDLAC